MNRWGRKLLRAIVLCGAIVTGVAMNSSDSKAAEIDPVDDAQPIQANQEENSEMTHSDELVQKMEDATEVIEGDAVAEEGYKNQAETEISNETLNQGKADELLSAGKAVAEQATEKLEEIKPIYEELSNNVEADENDFVDKARRNDLDEYANRCEQENDNEKKTEIVVDATVAAEAQHQELIYVYGEHSQAYIDLTNRIDQFENSIQVTQAECDEEITLYDQLQVECENIRKELEDLEKGLNGEDDPELIAYYNQQLEELVKLKEEYEASNAKFDEVYYDRATREDEVSKAESNKNEAMAKVKDAVINESCEEELSTQIVICAKLIEEYNQAVQHLEQWYDELDIAISERNEKKTAYIELQKIVNDRAQLIKQGERYKTLLQELKEVETKIEVTACRISDYKNIINNLNVELADALSEKELMDQHIYEIDKRYYDFVGAANVYKNSLTSIIVADELMNRAEDGYSRIVSSFEEMKEDIQSYMSPYKGNPYQKPMDKIDAKVDEMWTQHREGEQYFENIQKGISNRTLTDNEAEDMIKKAHKILDELANKHGEVTDIYYGVIDEVEGIIQDYEQGSWYDIDEEFSISMAGNALYEFENEYNRSKQKYDSAYNSHKEAADYYKSVQTEVDPIKEKIIALEKDRAKYEKDSKGEPGSDYAKAIEAAEEAQKKNSDAIEAQKRYIAMLNASMSQYPTAMTSQMIGEANRELAELYNQKQEINKMFEAAEKIRTDANAKIAELDREIIKQGNFIKSNFNESLLNEYYEFVQELEQKAIKAEADYLAQKEYYDSLVKTRDDRIQAATTLYNYACECRRVLQNAMMDSSECHGVYQAVYDDVVTLLEDYFGYMMAG